MLRLLAASTAAMLCGHAALGGAGIRAHAAAPQRSLPKAYTVLSEKIIKSLRDSFEAEAEGASESEVSTPHVWVEGGLALSALGRNVYGGLRLREPVQCTS